MKKYNKSEIMKEEWDLFKRRVRRTFAEALKRAWDNAKALLKAAEKAPVVVKEVMEKVEIKSIAPWFLYKLGNLKFGFVDSMEEMTIEKETEKAVLVSWDFDGRETTWIPKSAVEFR